MENRKDLLDSEREIKNKIYLYPLLILILGIMAMSFITFFVIDNFKKQELSELKITLLKKEKELSKIQAEHVIKRLNRYQEQTITILKEDLKKRIHEASDIIHNIIKENPKKSKEEIKKIVSIVLSPIRFFNKRGYYLVYDKDTNRSVIHPRKKFINKDMTNFKDSTGKDITKLFNEKLKDKNEAFVRFNFVKPNSNDAKDYEKIVILKVIPELNWVIGTGDYIDEVEKNIQYQLLKDLKEIRYGENSYFWIINNNYKLLMHPYREKDAIGKSQIDMQDSKGIYIAKLALKESLNNPSGTFIKYHWVKPGGKKEIEKINFVKYIPKWNWVISTGVYVEDINKIINLQGKLFDDKIKILYKNISMLILILGLIALILIFDLSKRIKDNFNKYSTQLYTMNDLLESKVEERTKELNKLNLELEDRIEEEVERNHRQEIQILQQSKFAQMGEMIGNIAHQWRQPLNVLSIIASSTKLNIELNTLKIEDLKKDLNIIINTTEQLSKTIDQFREFIKEERKLEKLILQDIIQNVMQLTLPKLSKNHIQLITRSEGNKPITIEIVKGELTQVLINIINNAKDILENKEQNEKWIKLIYKIKKHNVEIIIEDNAGGIDDKILDKVFNPYFTTKHQSQGTGIGLYMCKKIIEQNLMGSLTVENTPIGARFEIILPMVKEKND